MKKILLSLLSFLCVASSYAISLNGVEYTIDTLSMFSVGPGTTYYELRMVRADNGTNRLDAFLLAVDTRAPYVKVEQVLGTGKVVGCERPTKMAERSTTDKKIFFGGVNGDFFAYQAPVGTTVVNGEYACTPAGAGGGRRHGGVDADGRGVTAYTHTYSMQVQMPDASVLTINNVNGDRDENQLVLYNHHKDATTKTNAYGTEVKIQLLEGEEWATTGTMKAKVLEKQENVGSMPLAADYAVLSGHGTVQAALNKLNVGDEITLNFELRLDNEAVNVAQLIGGDHYEAMILDDGQIAQSGFWNELHPRTGYGVSQTRDTVFMIVVDGRGVSKGCTTKVMAEILKYYGAWNAVNWDGGGSSCLYVRKFGQVNNASDGSERAVTNAMFAVAELPEVDNTIAKIAPYVKVYVLPRYAVAVPKFLGYNKYGVLLDADVQGVKLSCDPELGEILPDGRFLASGKSSGVLLASYGDVTTELEVQLITTAPMGIRLDSVLCDELHPYQVEVQSVVGDEVVDLLAEAVSWKSLNPEIATVDTTGTVVGVNNGSTLVIGELGEFKDTILVNVEIPESHKIVWDDFRNTENWKLSGTKGYNPYLSVPESLSAPVNMIFNYTTGRATDNVQCEREAPFYSRPDTIRIPLTTDAVINKIQVFVRANNAKKSESITLEPKRSGEIMIEIPVEQSFGTDVAIYPLHFEKLKLMIDLSSEPGERYVTLPGIMQIYTGRPDVETGVEDVIVETSSTVKFVENGQLLIRRNGSVYTVLGTVK